MTTGVFSEHNLSLAEGLLGNIGEDDLLPGDRAFCSRNVQKLDRC